MRILITGGAGHIGSHCTRALLNQGHAVTVLDNLSTGQEQSIDPRARLINASLLNAEVISQTLRTFSVDTVLHFAGASKVSESLVDPAKYYLNNLGGTLNLLSAMRSSNVKKILYASSSSVYGEPESTPLTELHAKNPNSPYGRSLSMAEEMIYDYSHSYGITYCILRYSNIVGVGSFVHHDTHSSDQLIARLMQACLSPTREFKIYGLDYPTPDGTFIRDYIHIDDVIGAIALTLESCDRNPNQIYNLGMLKHYSVLEVVKACEEVTKIHLGIIPEQRQVGDSAVLTLSSAKIREQLGWRPRFENIEDILTDIWSTVDELSKVSPPPSSLSHL